MPFDPATIITSAVVGGFSGLVFATWKTGLEETAKRRMAARDQVRDASSELLAKVIKYEAGLTESREEVSDAWFGEYMWASKVLLAAMRLGPIRQHLVRRRLRVIVGKLCYDLAYARPAKFDDSFEDDVSLELLEKIMSEASPKSLGLAKPGLKAGRGSKETKKLRRHLTRLSKSR